MSTGSPKPWVCHFYDDYYEVTDLVGYPIARVTKYPRNSSVSDYNARLITIAPNMFELLMSCKDVVPAEWQEKIDTLLSATTGLSS